MTLHKKARKEKDKQRTENKIETIDRQKELYIVINELKWIEHFLKCQKNLIGKENIRWRNLQMDR